MYVHTHVHTSVPSASLLPCVCLSPSSSTMSFPSPLRQVAVRLISGQLFFRPMLYSYQMSLPNLPLPPLQDTLERVCVLMGCVHTYMCVVWCGWCDMWMYVRMFIHYNDSPSPSPFPLSLSLSLPPSSPSPSPSPSSSPSTVCTLAVFEKCSSFAQ